MEVDVEDWTDEGFFSIQKSAIILRHYLCMHEEFIPKVVPVVVHDRKDFSEDSRDDEPKISPGSSGVQLNLGDLLADVQFALDVQKRNRVIAQANLELIRMKDKNNKFIREGREPPHVIDRMSKLQVFLTLSADFNLQYMDEEKELDRTVIYGVDEDALMGENEDGKGNELRVLSVLFPYGICEMVRRGMYDIF